MNVILIAPPRSGAGLFQQVLVSDPAWVASSLSEPAALDERVGIRLDDLCFTSHRVMADDAPWLCAAADLVQADENAVTVDWNPRLALRVGMSAQALPDAALADVVNTGTEEGGPSSA